MNLCRCPYCRTAFKLDIPADSEFWERVPTDDEGMAMWVCLECHQQGKPALDPEHVHMAGGNPDISHLMHQALRPNM